MMKHYLPIILGSLILSCFTSCVSGPKRSYYTLTYPMPDPLVRTPYPYTIRVKEVFLRESYRRSEVVLRPDQFEIQYDRRQRWSERPQKMISGLLVEHVRTSGIARRVLHRTGGGIADFTLRVEVDVIEQAQSGDKLFARLKTTWSLIRTENDQVVWSWRGIGKKPVGTLETSSMRATVRELSGLLAQQATQAITKLSLFLQDPKRPMPTTRPKEKKKTNPTAQIDKILDWSPDSPYNDLPGLLADDTSVGVDYGAIFLPALSGISLIPREPTVGVYDESNTRHITDARMGKRIVLKPGVYVVHFGSGTAQQQQTVAVRVQAGRTTVVPPKWGVLSINVVDNTFVPFRGSYELIRMSNGEEYGLGIGADGQQGEQLRAWVLPTGVYKIIRTGGTYYDRTDFATVRLTEGAYRQYVLVIDPDTGEFEGAGEIDPRQFIAAGAKNWTFRGILGGNVSFTHRGQQVDAQEGWTMELAGFFEGRGRWQHKLHYWDTRLDLEESQRRDPQTNAFTNTRDRFFINSIYTYRWWPSFGPYVRLRLDTKLLPRYQAFSDPTDVYRQDEDGLCQPYRSDVDRIGLGGSFSPLELRQSTGGNIIIFRRRSVELDLRLGFAAQQTLTNDLVNYREEDNCLLAVDDSVIFGPEATLVGFVRLSRWVTLSTEFDGLLPIGDEDAVYTWRNQASLRLASFLSINYRLNLEYKPTLSAETQVDQDVQLRFSYPVF